MKLTVQNMPSHGLALILTFIISACSTGGVAPLNDKVDYGLIVLTDAAQDRTCTIDLGTTNLTERKTYRGNLDGCNFGWVGSMQLKNAKSATTLEIFGFEISAFPDGGNVTRNRCGWDDWDLPSYRIQLKTFGTYPETQTFSIEQILETEPGEVVVPGVRLLRKIYNPHRNSTGQNLSHLFNCMYIRRY